MVVCYLLLQADSEGPYPHLLRRLLRHTEVADPQLIGSPGMQLPVNPVQRTRRLCITDRGARHISTHHTAQAHAAHQSLDSTTRRCHTFACQLPPHLVGTIHLHIGLPDAFNLRHKCLVAMSPGAALVRLAQQRCMSSVSRRDNLQDLAERLDPEGIALLVNKGSHNFSRRSSYAGAKNALVSFSISLDRRSSLISRTSSLTCWASAVVTPSRLPAYTSARLTYSFRIRGTQPISGAMDSMAAHSDGYSPRCSCTILTARSRTSGEKLFVFFMAQSSQSVEAFQKLLEAGPVVDHSAAFSVELQQPAALL